MRRWCHGWLAQVQIAEAASRRNHHSSCQKARYSNNSLDHGDPLSAVVLVHIRERVELTCRLEPLCRRSKLQAVPGGGREEPIQHRFGDQGRRRGTILSGIKRLRKEI